VILSPPTATVSSSYAGQSRRSAGSLPGNGFQGTSMYSIIEKYKSIQEAVKRFGRL